MTHYGIPWPLFRKLVRFVRVMAANRSVPDQTHLQTEATIPQLRRALGKRHFTNAWELSYHYSGEDLNMRRPDYDETDARPWKQTHVRGFDKGRKRTLYAHVEYEPTEYPDAHLHNENLSVERGLNELADLLDDAGIRYQVVA